MDPDQPQAGPSALPTTVAPEQLSNQDIRNILVSLSANMHTLTDRVVALTTQVTTLTNAQAAVAAAAPVRPKSKDNVKRPESWKGKGSSADAR